MKTRPRAKHGCYYHPLYRTWQDMMDRCYNPNNAAYQHYGGRGITVCERWHNVAAFIEDIGPRPDGLTLDRFPDKNGRYEPENVRWATHQEQNLNRRPRRPHFRVTHCNRGHEYTPENTGTKAVGKRTGKRYCRTCNRAYQRTRYAQF